MSKLDDDSSTCAAYSSSCDNTALVFCTLVTALLSIVFLKQGKATASILPFKVLQSAREVTGVFSRFLISCTIDVTDFTLLVRFLALAVKTVPTIKTVTVAIAMSLIILVFIVLLI